MTDERLLSAREAMAYLGVSRTFLTDHREDLRAIRVGSLLKFRRSNLETYLSQRQFGTAAPEQPAETPAPRRGRIADLFPPGTINPLTREPFTRTAEYARTAGRSQSADVKRTDSQRH